MAQVMWNKGHDLSEMFLAAVKDDDKLSREDSLAVGRGLFTLEATDQAFHRILEMDSVLNSISDTGSIRPVYWPVSYTGIRSQYVLPTADTDSVRIHNRILVVYGQYWGLKCACILRSKM